MKKILSLFVLSIILQNPLQAEIETVTIRWTAQLCQASCTKLLENELKKIHGVNEISLDQGQAILTWKEKTPFHFTSINTAMRMVGLSMRTIRIKVKGSITHIGDTFYIVSEGDNTRFELLNPVVPHPTGQASEFNASARKLSPELRKKLIEGQLTKQIATIEGPIFMPERNTIPTQIVIDQLSFSEPKEKENSK